MLISLYRLEGRPLSNTHTHTHSLGGNLEIEGLFVKQWSALLVVVGLLNQVGVK